MTSADVALVSMQRLGELLTNARIAADVSLPELADRSAGRFSASDLLAIEGGNRELVDADVQAVVQVYGVDPGELVPERSRLVIDLDRRKIAAGPNEHKLKAPTPDEVLATYLSLVYTMRHTVPGTPVPLRQTDIDVLSRALEIAGTDIETRLVTLMADPAAVVSSRQRLLRSRFLLPVAGIVVAATAVGTLVLVNAVANDGTAPGSNPAAVVSPTVVQAPAGNVTVSLIPPIVVERNADGTPGPQHVVGQPPIANGLEPGRAGASTEGLAPAQVVERNADGTPSSQQSREPVTSSSVSANR